jgi:hypothetical protein
VLSVADGSTRIHSTWLKYCGNLQTSILILRLTFSALAHASGFMQVSGIPFFYHLVKLTNFVFQKYTLFVLSANVVVNFRISQNAGNFLTS